MSGKEIEPRRVLSLFDCLGITTGVIIGVGLFESAPLIARSIPNVASLLFFWVLGGAISLCGALCYAELASMYPRDGGEFVYLSEAYHEKLGFLFAWTEFTIIRPGSIAAMAFPFATYAFSIFPVSVFGLSEQEVVVAYVVSAIAILTALNIVGTSKSTIFTNILSVTKVLALILFIICALFSPSMDTVPFVTSERPNHYLGLILILFCYGGWNEIAYIAGEVKEPERNFLKTMIVSMVIVTVIYVGANWAFSSILGLRAFMESEAVAADSLTKYFPDVAVVGVSLIICISALSAMNGLILTGARVPFVMGQRYTVFQKFAYWSKRSGSPVKALTFQGGMAIAVALFTGSFGGTVVYTTSVVWIFYALTALGVIVLRRKLPGMPRPYRVTGYPYTTGLFLLSSCFLVYSAFMYNVKGSCISICVALFGLFLYRKDSRHIESV